VIARVSALGAWTTLVYAFILSPIAVILIASFTAADYTSFPPQGWSLRWYAEIPRHPEFLEALWVSLVVAVVSATLATILGTLAALALVRYRFRGRALFNAFFLSPLMLPTVILGLALLQFYALVGITRTPASLVCGHLVITVPYVIRLVGAGLAGLDPSLERAAMSLGATPWRTFRAITLPLIGPGVAAGAAFAAIVSFDDVNIALFLASPRAPTMTTALTGEAPVMRITDCGWSPSRAAGHCSNALPISHGRPAFFASPCKSRIRRKITSGVVTKSLSNAG
jgi:putative spermidine/putrescine transport system permease protein